MIHTVPLAAAILLAIAIGCALLRRAFARVQVPPEEVALAAAWVFVVGGLVWLNAFLSGSSLLGFSVPWTWLAASHFAAAGFGAITITALTCRAVSDARAARVLRLLLVGRSDGHRAGFRMIVTNGPVPTGCAAAVMCWDGSLAHLAKQRLRSSGSAASVLLHPGAEP